MNQLDTISIQDLHELLSTVDGNMPTQRVLATIAYKQGDSKSRIAERHGVTWKTIDGWIDRFVEQPIDQAPHDERRSGRPPKLVDAEREALFADLRKQPTEFGYDYQEWSPELVTHHVEKTFDVTYSQRHIRRIMKEVGLA
jgi:transposase